MPSLEIREKGSPDEEKEESKESEDNTFSLTEVVVPDGNKKDLFKQDEDDDGFGLDDRFIAEIMMSLDSEKIGTLRKAFEQNDDDGLSLAEFVHVMTSILDMSHLMTSEQFAANLVEFFDQVDINGDGAMEWEEFTSFIVETGMSEHDHQPDAISEYFFTAMKETGNHNAYVERIAYHKNDTVTMFDTESKQVRVYNSKMEFINFLKSGGACVSCCEYIELMNYYAISTTDLSINFFDGNNCQLVKKFRTPNQNTTVMCWVEGKKLLFTGDTRGSVKAWDCHDMEVRFEVGMKDGFNQAGIPMGRKSLGLHRDIILDIIELDELEVLATASMDRTIKLWDLPAGKLKRTLTGHAKGVRKITYNSEYRFLISVGFDFDVLVWNPYVANLILRLSDHGCSLCGVEIIPSTPILISADIEGTFRVWDVRNFLCVQSFKADEKRAGQLKGFCTIASTKRIVAVGRSMHFFDYDKIEMPELTDEFPLCCALYNKTSSTFITCSVKFVKIWDASKGTLERVYRNLSTSDITAMCLDFRERKFILGDHDGNLHCYDFLNGVDMKEFAYEETDDKAHLNEISKLLYCDEHATVISTSWDRSLCIHSESEAEEGVLLRRIEKAHRTDITALAHSHMLSLIATGSADSTLKIWDYEFCRLDSQMSGHTSPISCVHFLDPYPALLSCDAGGNVMLWAVRPSRTKGKVLARWKNRPPNKKAGGKPQAAAITIITTYCKFAGSEGRFGSKLGSGDGDSGDEGGNEDFVSSNMGSTEDARRWIERLERLRKNKAKKIGRKEKSAVEEYLVYAGDERGNVVVWDLLPTMEALADEHGGSSQGMGAMESPFECGNPRRHIVYNAGEGGSGKEEGGEGGGGVAKTRGAGDTMSTNVVSIIATWPAHSDAVTSLQIIDDPASLLTASTDCLARVWERNGRLMGVLRQGGLRRGEAWEFELDMAGIGEKKLEFGGAIMSEVRGMGDLELDSSDEEDNVSATLTMISLDPLAIKTREGGTEEEKVEKMYRRTPKRTPVNPATVGRRRGKRK